MKHYLIHEIPLGLDQTEKRLAELVASRFRVPVTEVTVVEIVRKSLDARKNRAPAFKYSLLVAVPEKYGENFAQKGIAEYLAQEHQLLIGEEEKAGEIIVVGSGPAGLFAAHLLARHGYRPILLERGQMMDERVKTFTHLKEDAVLDAESNVCFGEGGAGTFSDGKLTARNKNPLTKQVLELLVAHGAPKEIAYLAKPHVGTEFIRKSISGIRKEIERLGGTVLFGAKLVSLVGQGGALNSIVYEKDGAQVAVDAAALVLAIGHSARDTYEMLLGTGLYMERKPFAIGVRVEHSRAFVDATQYGAYAGHPKLGAAEYALKAQVQGRGVYSFCMCPGGEVVCSATEAGHTAVNGMSWYHRDMPFSNSALVVTMGKEDMQAGPLGGIALQRSVECAAYNMADGYGAPAQAYRSFIDGTKPALTGETSYKPYVVAGALADCLPRAVSLGLREAAATFNRRMPGFVKEGVLLGVETRTSSPVRIVRDDTLQANIRGVYPAGEGAGYAGGIMSAAIDGLKVATQIIGKYRPD